ncbi:MAG: FRG domain-containing protein [Gammaproteobacteria bacterium]|nr:FRG domain-containing protein [Gammaproteobacteria bacterium]
MREDRLKNWNELTRLADAQKRGGWLYRGETRCDYKLVSKIGREGARKDHQGRDLPYDDVQERLLLEEFKRQARPMLELQPQSKLELMAVAQHHGLKTRLLDWTDSLLVAAMFATEKGVTIEKDLETGKEKRIPPVIYAVCGLAMASDTDDPFKLDQVSVYRPAHISPRIAPQQGVFTVHPKPCERFDHAALVKWILDIDGTLEIKLALDAVGISRGSLFPGIDGLTEALNWRHKWNVLRR